MNIFQKIKFINNISKAWTRSKKLIDDNKGVAEEARQIALEQIALFERMGKLFPPAKAVIQGLIEIVKNALA